MNDQGSAGEDEDDFAEQPAGARAPGGRKRSLPPSSGGLQQNPETMRRICELGRQSLPHPQISAALHAEGLLNSKGARWGRSTDGKVIERVLSRNGIALATGPEPVAAAAARAPAEEMRAPRADALRGEAGADDAFDERGTAVARPAPASGSLHDARAAVAPPRPGRAVGAGCGAPRTQLQAAACALCTGPFAATGRHQPCSLACGHIFGRSCITTHLFRSKACSLCGAAARRAAIRPLYAFAQAPDAAADGEQPAAASAVEVQTRAEDALCERLELELAGLQSELGELQQRSSQLRASALLGAGGGCHGAGGAAAAPEASSAAATAGGARQALAQADANRQVADAG